MYTILKNLKGDKMVWATIALLGLFSFLPIYSASSNLVYVVGKGTTLGYFIKHIVLLFLGFVIIIAVHRIPYNYFKALSVITLPIVIVLLIFTLSQGNTVSGANASRWIRVPFVGVSFQTSNFASVVLLSYVVRYLVKLKKRDMSTVTFTQALTYLWLPVFLIIGLIVPANLSTGVILMAIIFVLCFITGYPMKHLLRIFLIGISIFSMFILFSKAFPGAVPNRVDTWVNRMSHFFDNDDNDDYYQVTKAKIAIATGGITGVGAGKSVMKNFLPQSTSDFIYAIIVEEYGLIGGLVLLMLYLYFLFRIMIIVHKAEDTYGKLMVIALSSYILFQAFINMSVAVHLLPVTGQNLPLISSGGTSIWATCMSIGIILAISSNNKVVRAKEKVKNEENKINPLEILSGQV